MIRRQHTLSSHAPAGFRSAGGSASGITMCVAIAGALSVLYLCALQEAYFVVCGAMLVATQMLASGPLASPIHVAAAAGRALGEGRPILLAMEGQTPAYLGTGGISPETLGSEPPPKDRLVPEYLPEDWLSSTRAVRQGAWENALHRGLDIVASLALLMLVLPLLLLVALAIKLDSRGPIFYCQERVGRDNRVFSILKFRSMTVDAEKPGTAVWASVQDSRVTWVGRLIRHYRIDEIPQTINILRGDMSFVGPRPERPNFVTQLTAAIPHYADRAAVRPGLTGWAQVRYPYGASIEDARNKLAFDLWYIQERSIWLDLRIMVATVRVVLGQVGAR